MSVINTYENALRAEGAAVVGDRGRGGAGEGGSQAAERGLPGLNPVASLEIRSMSISENVAQGAIIVPDERRLDFLPTLFGRSLLIVAENAVYSFMERLSPLDYRGGFWDFYEHDGTPLFMAPKSITGLQGEASAEAAGITATLFTFSHLSFQYRSDRLPEGYGRLHNYSADHPEASEIFQAID